MPHHLTSPIDAWGPMFDLTVTVSAARRYELTQRGEPVPEPIKVRALVDTGATTTSIHGDVLRQLGLEAFDHATMKYADSASEVGMYECGLVFPESTPGKRPHVIPAWPVCAWPSGHQFAAVVGRDMLRHCYLMYSGPVGVFTLAFHTMSAP